ncbi:MAG: Ig-like domain-containing protein [Actinomycetota bacterium]
MRPYRALRLALAAAALAGAIGVGVPSAAPASAAASLDVMGWVPPYGVATSQAAVTADLGAFDVQDGLSRVGLQFWVPNTDGTIRYATHESYKPGDADVAWWKTWAQPKGIKVLLCIYNNTGSWDWALARSAFGTNRTTFVNALVAEMDRLGLDGIDVDLEGVGSYDTDRAAFGSFISALATAVHARGKLLTVDSFHYIWNAPNQSWWPDWVGNVDTIHTMGYDDLYEGGTGYHRYSFQQTTGVNAGLPASAISMGFPGWKNTWGTSSGRGTDVLAHLAEVRNDLPQPSGIAIWDLQLSASNWRSSAVWEQIAALRGPLGNRAPTATAQTLTTNTDTARAVTLSGIDPDADPLTFAVASGPSHGGLSGTAPNLTYTPASGWTGADAFTFTASDGALTSAAATVTVTTVAPGTLPAGWSSASVGTTVTDGSASYDPIATRWSVTGYGAGLAGTADRFRYAWSAMSGDGEIRARIASAPTSPTGAIVGVTIRETTAAGARHHFIGLRADGRIVWIRRNGTDRSTSIAVGTTAVTAPIWVRLVRSGTTITAFTSTDGITWTRFNNAKLSMATAVTAGIAVASSSTSSPYATTLDGVVLVP